MIKKWKCKKSELILDSRFFKVRKDTVELPNGQIKEWIFWDSQDSAMVLGVTRSKSLVMIRQYRYLVGDSVIEFPSGGREGKETMEECALREFLEETGYQASQLIRLGAFYETYGQLNRRIHIFYAPEVSRSTQDLDHDERGFEDIKVELVRLEQAIKMALDNAIVAMGSALAVLLLKTYLEQRKGRNLSA